MTLQTNLPNVASGPSCFDNSRSGCCIGVAIRSDVIMVMEIRDEEMHPTNVSRLNRDDVHGAEDRAAR